MRTAIATVAVGIGLSVFVACGSSSVVLQPVDDGGTESGLPEAAVDAEAGGANVGVVQMKSYSPPSTDAGNATVFARFVTGQVSACAETIVGGCSVNSCDLTATPTGVPVSAGQLVISGGLQKVTLIPKNSDYVTENVSTRLWNGGEVLSIVGAGATAPAFNLSVITPSYVTVTDPPWPANGKLTIDRTQPWSFTWTGGGAGEVMFNLNASTGKSAVLLSCAFPAASGAAVISPAVLAKLPPSSTQAMLSIESHTVIQSTAGSYAMVFHATAQANTPSSLATATVAVP
jgi:hypothetical protein